MELGGYKFDQTAEFIGKGASVTTRPITFIKGMFLHTDHEVDQENANVLQDCQGAFHICLILEGQLELLQLLVHLCLSHLIYPRALLKDLHYLIADGFEFDVFLLRVLLILDVIIDLARQYKVNIKLARVVVLRNQIAILEKVCIEMVLRLRLLRES